MPSQKNNHLASGALRDLVLLQRGHAIRNLHRHRAVASALAALSFLIGSAAALSYASAGLSLSHYDARAHLVVARRIIDSLTPGWQQVGAVWLPLPHVVNMLPVQIDWLYRTGASAILFSVLSLAIAVWAIASLIVRTTGSISGAAAASALILLNPNVLYLQSTPMTEPMLFATTMLAVMFTCEWLDGVRSSNAAGLALAGACLTRYEAWPITGAVVGLAGLVLLRRGTSIMAATAAIARLAVPPAVAVALFLVNSRWTVGSWFVSSGFFVPENTEALGHASVALHQVRIGLYQLSGTALVWSGYAGAALVVAAFGGPAFMAGRRLGPAPTAGREVGPAFTAGREVAPALTADREVAPALTADREVAPAFTAGRKVGPAFTAGREVGPAFMAGRESLLVLLALAASAAVPWYAYLHGHPFRIRYDVPLIAACGAIAGAGIGLLWRPVRPVVAALLVAASLMQAHPLDRDAPLIKESQRDASNKAGRAAVTAYLVQHYDGGTIMMSMGSLGHYMHDLSAQGFRIRDFLHEGNGDIWALALTRPRTVVRWIAIEEKAEGGDALYQEARRHPRFLEGFERIAEGGGVALYRAQPR